MRKEKNNNNLKIIYLNFNYNRQMDTTYLCQIHVNQRFSAQIQSAFILQLSIPSNFVKLVILSA